MAVTTKARGSPARQARTAGSPVELESFNPARGGGSACSDDHPRPGPGVVDDVADPAGLGAAVAGGRAATCAARPQVLLDHSTRSPS